MTVVFMLDLLVGLLVLLVLAFVGFAARRRLIQRRGGTFDCSLRLTGRTQGKGWAFGVARYSGDRVEWYRIFSFSPRPKVVLVRHELELGDRRRPAGDEELALLTDSIIIACTQRGRRIELAMSEDALTGFLAWLEAAPPGQRVNVA